ncbi:hypothetical protein [Streptomyces sp. NRRL F-2747]|uniref:hypothetical protein n=1 Tax=Streptomyces sp. NRRL F-2747 TaxID=1463843 RepID=UPI00099C1017|nr:hypothetical protein [Streptomyces sp. NRRL F-2747]
MLSNSGFTMSGKLARVRTSEGPDDDDVVFEQSAERPMELRAEAGENLLQIVPLLGPDSRRPTHSGRPACPADRYPRSGDSAAGN